MKHILKPAIAMNLVEPLYLSNLHPGQKYRLTKQGKEMIGYWENREVEITEYKKTEYLPPFPLLSYSFLLPFLLLIPFVR